MDEVAWSWKLTVEEFNSNFKKLTIFPALPRQSSSIKTSFRLVEVGYKNIVESEIILVRGYI